MYDDVIEKIDRMSKLIYTVLLEVSVPTATLSYIFNTLSNFYIVGLGNDSYEDILLMYVIACWFANQRIIA